MCDMCGRTEGVVVFFSFAASCGCMGTAVRAHMVGRPVRTDERWVVAGGAGR